MPFIEDEPVRGPLALPNGFDLNPEQEESDSSVLGAAWRIGSPIGSAGSTYHFDQSEPFDPEYRPYEDIEGTVYEGFSDRFAGARTVGQVERMKAQIDREIEDRKALEAAGGWGLLGEMGASLISPTTLIPGGAVVRGITGGVQIGRTAMTVAGSTGLAVALDEIALQQTQQTRTAAESAMAIGGGVLLGGLLGTAAGGLSRGEFARSAASIENLPADLVGFNDRLRSVGAAENVKDMEVRREELFQFMNSSQFRVEERLRQFLPDRVAEVAAAPLAVLRPFVRSDPILRAILSTNNEARRALADLVETPLQYKANEDGQTVLSGSVSVETAVKTRRNAELAEALGQLDKGYMEYFNDGSVGMVGRLSTTLTGPSQRLLGMTEKMSRHEFMEAVGEAAMRGDTHPVPQVAQAAQAIRRVIFDKAMNDAIDVGLFDESLAIKNGKSYFMRVYNTEKIEQHFGDGTENDIATVLRDQFFQKREAARTRLEKDDTVERAQDELAKARESLTQTRRALRTATKKAQGKRDRAKAATAREGRVQRVTDALRKNFEARAKKLREGLIVGEELEAFKQVVKEARNPGKLEPVSVLPMIRAMGGIRDPRVKNSWTGRDWESDGTRTDLEEILDTRAPSIRRGDGKEPDMIREAMEEAGYLPEGSTVNDLYELIRKEASGEKQYSLDDAVEVEQYLAAQKLADDFEAAGIDLSKPIEQIINSLDDTARSQKIAKAKAQEAGRSARKAGEAGNSRIKSVKSGGVNVKVAKGKFRLLHGYSGRSEVGIVEGFSGERYDGGSNVLGNDGLYLDGDGKWTANDPARMMFSTEQVAEVEVDFQNALILSPDTAASISKAAGQGDDLTSGVEIAAWAKRQGHDGVIVTGFDEQTARITQNVPKDFDFTDPAQGQAFRDADAEIEKLGMNSDVGQDQVIVFKPESARVIKDGLQPGTKVSPIAEALTQKPGTKSPDPLMASIQRLDDANARLKELREDIGPKVKEDMKKIRAEIAENLEAVQKAKEARSADEYYGLADDVEVEDAVSSAIQSILGMKVGTHSITTAMANPRNARTLDVDDEFLMPWLETDMGTVVGQYFNSVIPEIETDAEVR